MASWKDEETVRPANSTESVTALEVTEPQESVTTTSYAPASAK
jgi:hypothetical protein